MGNAESGPELEAQIRPNEEDPMSMHAGAYGEDRYETEHGVVDSSDDEEDDPDWVEHDAENFSPNRRKQTNIIHPKALRGSMKVPPMEFEVVEESSGSEDEPLLELDDITETASALMEASAAVFHYLAKGGSAADISVVDDDDLSVGERSEAVFEYLEEEAKKGNGKPMREFLETAAVVSDILMEDESGKKNKQRNHKRNPGAPSQIGRYSSPPANVSFTMENASSISDENSISHRSAQVFQMLDETRSGEEGEDRYQTSDASKHVAKAMDEAKNVDARSVSDFSSAVFRLIDADKKAQEEADDGRSVSELSSAVFKMLDEYRQAPRSSSRKSRSSQKPKSILHVGSEETQEKPKQGNSIQIPSASPRGSLLDRIKGVSHQGPPKPSNGEETPVLLVEEQRDELSTVYSGVSQQFSEVLHADTSEQDMDDEIDLVFVERFDTAFNEFISQHPEFIMNNPELVHQLRITKLQRLLAYMENCESDLLAKMATIKGDKEKMENRFQLELRKASRKKAARQINLQSEITQISHATKVLQADRTWKLLLAAQSRTKRVALFRQEAKAEKAKAIKDPSGIPTRRELLAAIPHDMEGQELRIALLAKPSDDEQSQRDALDNLRQLQVDNAFMNAEVGVLKKKLAYLQIAAKKQAWVDSILLRMDDTTTGKLKAKFLAKVGLTSL